MALPPVPGGRSTWAKLAPLARPAEGFGRDNALANLARVSLTSDMVFGDDGGVRQLGTVTGDGTSGYTVSLAVPVDTRTTPSGGGAPGGGGPGGGGPGGAPPA